MTDKLEQFLSKMTPAQRERWLAWFEEGRKEFREDTYEDKRFNAYTHWCNENNKSYNKHERDMFYKMYDAEQQIKKDFEEGENTNEK